MAQQPNVLFIMTDDQAEWTLGAHVHPNAFTPQLDRLAAKGACFDNFFANAAVCSPSRASLITGRYPSETGIAVDGDVTHIKPHSEEGLAPALRTWPELLQAAGYKTALVGKWHMGHARKEYHPATRGYDHFSGWIQNGNYSRDPYICVEGEQKTYTDEYTPDVLANLTMDYIRSFQDQPWAISLHFWAPHANHGVPETFTLPYNDRTWLPLKDEDLAHWNEEDISIPNPEFPNLDVPRVRRMTREYHASVHAVDRNVGRLLDFIETSGLANNTVIIFTSDQGYNMAHHGLWHKGNGKWITTDRKDPEGIYGNTRENLFDNSLRVPAIVHWPGVVPPDTRITQFVSFVDWFPTILEITGVDIPAELRLRGTSFVPLLRGEEKEWPDTVFAQHRALRTYRNPEWKLIRDWSGEYPDELYHLREDPFEKNNLINAENPLIEPIKQRLDQQMRETMKRIDDPVLQKS